MRTNGVPFSVYGVPMLGLIGMLVCLWHPHLNLQSETMGSQVVFLADPCPQLDKSRTIFLRQEAKNVAYSRKHSSLEIQAQTIADYNLIAQECTPAVFEATHMPSSLSL